jgi:hypothetical protein
MEKNGSDFEVPLCPRLQQEEEEEERQEQARLKAIKFWDTVRPATVINCQQTSSSRIEEKGEEGSKDGDDRRR